MKKNVMSLPFLAVMLLSLTACPADNSGDRQKGQEQDSQQVSQLPPLGARSDADQSEADIPVQKKQPVPVLEVKKINGETGEVQLVSNGWFSYTMPAAWRANTNPAEDEEYRVYEAKMFPRTRSKKIPSYIYVSYFAEDNEDIPTYQEFVRVNSQNVLMRGKTSEWEKYEPVKEATVAGRKAYIVARNCRHFLHPNSKNDDYVMKKEKMYVFPAQKGYYVVRYAADADYFNENIKRFEAIAASFKGKY